MMRGRQMLAVVAASCVLGTAQPARAQDTCDLTVDCVLRRAQGVEACPFDILQDIDKAANGALGGDAPSLPAVQRGCNAGVDVRGRVPCQLLRAFAWVRSGWRQFCGEGCAGNGELGPTRMGATCGVGLMQIPENEAPEGAILDRVAASSRYNAGTGALRLAEAWATSPCVGGADPDVAEHWYFAVWAADVFSYANNPNNPSYPVLRGNYGSLGGLDRDSYPFQEAVFGAAGNPPRDGDLLWNPAPVTLPDTDGVCGTAGCLAGAIASPNQTHGRDCPPLPPDGGTPGEDGGTDDAGPDAGADAGNIQPDPSVKGCTCRVGAESGDGALVVLALLLGLVVRIGPARRSR
jgi:MYXO-CTERM domain-containing protein